MPAYSEERIASSGLYYQSGARKLSTLHNVANENDREQWARNIQRTFPLCTSLLYLLRDLPAFHP
jgi:hypothetical protein